MTTEIIRLINITSRHSPSTRLDGISMNLLKGEIVGIHSLSTSQRSAILDVVCGLLPPNSGSMFIYGKHLLRYSNILEVLPKLSRISVDSSLVSSFTVWENLMLYGRERHSTFIYKKLLQQYTIQLLQEFGFPSCCNTNYDQLPFIYQYALQILKAWDTGSNLLILDDSLPNLTAEEHSFLLRLFHKLTDLGVSFLISSRYLSRLSKVCDRIYFVDQYRTCKETSGKTTISEHILPVKHEGYPSLEQHPSFIGSIDHTLLSGTTLRIPFLEGKNIAIVDTTKMLNSICTAKNRRVLRKKTHSNLKHSLLQNVKHENKSLLAEYGLHGYVSKQLSPVENLCLGISRQFSFLIFQRPTITRYLARTFSDWCREKQIELSQSCENDFTQLETATILYKLHLTHPKLLLFHYNGTASLMDSIDNLVAGEFRTHTENGMAICTICTNIEHLPFFADYFILVRSDGIYYNVHPDYLRKVLLM